MEVDIPSSMRSMMKPSLYIVLQIALASLNAILGGAILDISVEVHITTAKVDDEKTMRSHRIRTFSAPHCGSGARSSSRGV